METLNNRKGFYFPSAMEIFKSIEKNMAYYCKEQALAIYAGKLKAAERIAEKARLYLEENILKDNQNVVEIKRLKPQLMKYRIFRNDKPDLGYRCIYKSPKVVIINITKFKPKPDVTNV